MSKSDDKHKVEEMRAEYDFSDGVRGKYAKRYAEGSNVVVLDPDFAEHFKTSEEVNEALRKLAEKEAS
ncbi:MAG: hypothetical protein GY722_19810 [bacterium]|nr:hypothetical protein [bacterium]